MRLPYLVAVRRHLTVGAVVGVATGTAVTVATALAGWSDGWAAVAQMATFVAGPLVVLYVVLRAIYLAAPRLFPGLGIDTSRPDGYLETLAVAAVAVLSAAAVVNLGWLAAPSGLW